MTVDTDDVFKEIRKSCSPSTWSKGVQLVRASAVAGVSESAEELVCRVRVPQRAVAPTVMIYPEDEEWDCDCESKAPCCEHVAAAIIAVRRSHAEGTPLAQSERSGARLEYRFKKVRDHLVLERFVVGVDGSSALLPRSLSSLVASPRDPHRLTPSQGDIAIDRLMGQRLHGQLLADAAKGVLLTLAGTPHVTLDGEAVDIESTPLKPIAHVRDADRGFVVAIERDPSVTSVVVPGVVRAGSTLRVLAETDLTGESLERLPSERHFGPKSVSVLVTEVLPELMKRLPVEVRTKRLPKLTRTLKPRLVLDVQQEGNTLSVLPTLWYGQGARVDGDQLVHISGDVPVRNKEAERGLARKLFEQLTLSLGSRAIVSGDPAGALAARLDSWQGEIRGRATDRFIRRDDLEALVSYEAGSLSMSFQSSDASGPHTASAQAVLSAWRAGSELVPLAEGGWAPLPKRWLDRHGHRVSELLGAKQAAGGDKLPAHALPALGELCAALGLAQPEELERLAPLIEGFDSIPRAPRPSGLTAELRDYQARGVDWLCFLRDAELGAMLADDMGLGKTLQALCSVAGKTLVICPRSVLSNWAKEAARFRPNLRVHTYHGPRRELDTSADVTLTTYAVLRLDQDVLCAEPWSTVVLDEAQAIKNPDSQVARAAFRLHSPFRVTLSGTPVENRLEELWSLMHFTNPGLLGSRQYFRDEYESPIAEGRPEAAERLRRKIRPFLLRRLKSEVARELPPRSDITIPCTLDDDERAVYDAIRAATQKEIVQQLHAGGSVLRALEALLRLRQAACHSALVPGQSAERSSKVEELCSALEQVTAEGHKSLVFSQWTALLDLIEPQLRAAGLPFVRLDGSTRDRQAVVDGFQAADGPPVFLLSLMAGGTGLNLTAADHVFLMDLWWNPAVEDQAADRAHRIGQERPVFVHRLVAQDTVEERILALQEKKRSIADAALGDASQAGGLTREDLLTLLE